MDARDIDSAEQCRDNIEAVDYSNMETNGDKSEHESEDSKHEHNSVSEKHAMETKSNFSSLAHLVPNFERKFHEKVSEKLKNFPVLIRVSKIVMFEMVFLIFLLVISGFFALAFSQTIDSFNPRNNLAIGRDGPGLAFRPRPQEVKSTLIEFIHGGGGDWWG